MAQTGFLGAPRNEEWTARPPPRRPSAMDIGANVFPEENAQVYLRPARQPPAYLQPPKLSSVSSFAPESSEEDEMRTASDHAGSSETDPSPLAAPVTYPSYPPGVHTTQQYRAPVRAVPAQGPAPLARPVSGFSESPLTAPTSPVRANAAVVQAQARQYAEPSNPVLPIPYSAGPSYPAPRQQPAPTQVQGQGQGQGQRVPDSQPAPKPASEYATVLPAAARAYVATPPATAPSASPTRVQSQSPAAAAAVAGGAGGSTVSPARVQQGAQAQGPSTTTGPVDPAAWVAPWFLGNTSVDDALAAISGSPDGVFVVRRKSPGELQLFLSHQGRTHPFSIEILGSTLHLAVSSLYFATLSELILYYSAPWTPENRDLPCALLVQARKELDPAERSSNTEVWSCGDVCAWLEERGLGQYCSAFRARAIDGHKFANLVDRDIERLGVQDPQHRQIIKDGIAELATHVEVNSGSHGVRPQRRTLVVKQINGQTKIFDAATGEEVEAQPWLNLLGPAAAPSAVQRNAFEWLGDEGGWRRHTRQGVITAPEWSQADLFDWLHHVGLGECADIFRRENITVDRLLQLTPEELRALGGETHGDQMCAAGELFHVKAFTTRGRPVESVSASSSTRTLARTNSLRSILHWYQPHVKEDDAAAIVSSSDSGAFVIWDRPDRDGYGLTMNADGVPTQYNIVFGPDHRLKLAQGTESFDSLQHLVDFYSTTDSRDLPCRLNPHIQPSSASALAWRCVDSDAREASWFRCLIPPEEADASLGETETTFFIVRDCRDTERATGTVFVLAASDANRNVQLKSIAADEEGLYVMGANETHYRTLSELVYTHSNANCESPFLVRIHTEPREHEAQPWFRPEISQDDAFREITKLGPAGNFIVRRPGPAGSEEYELCFVSKGRSLTKAIRKSAQGYFVEDATLHFPTLQALVDYYRYVTDPVFPMLLTSSRTTSRGLNTAQGHTALSLVDASAAAAPWYLEGVVPSRAVAALADTLFGAFVVCCDLHNDQLLWLHHVGESQIHTREIAVVDGKLQLQGDTASFPSLSTLVDHYSGDWSDVLSGRLRPSWTLTRPAPFFAAGPDAHTDASWFMTEGDETMALVGQADGFFVVSPAQQPAKFLLSYAFSNGVRQVHIYNKGRGLGFAETPTSFISLSALVASHHFVRGDLSCLLRGAELLDEGFGDSQSPWLQPHATRADADHHLARQPDGSFLVRRSESYPDCHVLSYASRGAVLHELIAADTSRAHPVYLCSNPTVFFPNLEALVNHYHHDATGLQCVLRSPVPEGQQDPSYGHTATHAYEDPTHTARAFPGFAPAPEPRMTGFSAAGGPGGSSGNAQTWAAFPWWAVGVPAREAQEHLRQGPYDGNFVIRDSGRCPDKYVLTYMFQGSLHHEYISFRYPLGVSLDNAPEPVFSSLLDLVRFYSAQPRAPLLCALDGSSVSAIPREFSSSMRQHTEHELQEAHRDLFQEFHQSRAIDTESLPGSVDHLTLLSQHQVSMAYLKQKGRLGQRSLPGPGEQHTHRSHHRHTHTRHTATTNMQASSSATRARSGPMETGVGTQTNGSGERVIYARPHSAKHTASTTAAHTEGTATTSHYARLSRSRDSYTRAVAAEFDAATRDWLRMDLDKPAVKKLLRGRPNGSFYVHSSPRAWAALTMVVNRQLYTRDIENVSDGVRFVRGTYTAPSLLDLVNESHRPSQVDLPACLGKDSI